MRKNRVSWILAAGALLLATQSARAATPYQGGVDAIIPLAIRDENLGVPLLLGFLTSFIIFGISSFRRNKQDKRRFLAILFSDFWFEGFITPGLGTILLVIFYGIFWGFIYFLIWAVSGGYINPTAFATAIILDISFYLIMRAMLESIVSITKTAESANAIIKQLGHSRVTSGSDERLIGTETESIDVKMFIDDEPIGDTDYERNE